MFFTLGSFFLLAREDNSSGRGRRAFFDTDVDRQPLIDKPMHGVESGTQLPFGPVCDASGAVNCKRPTIIAQAGGITEIAPLFSKIHDLSIGDEGTARLQHANSITGTASLGGDA